MAPLVKRWWPLVLVLAVAWVIWTHPRKPVFMALPLDANGCVTIPQGVMYSAGLKCLPRTYVPTPEKRTP